MAYIALSGITGCFNPASGGTTDQYGTTTGTIYNNTYITMYYKRDIIRDFVTIYMVEVMFSNRFQQFQFYSPVLRDAFYDSLPK